jgi:hypothetical protein
MGAMLAGCAGDSYRLGRASPPETAPDAAPGGSVTRDGGSDTAQDAGSDRVGSDDRCAIDPVTERADPSRCSPLTSEFVEIVNLRDVNIGFLAADESHVYFNSWRGSVWRTDHDGRNVELLADDESYHLAADDTHVYWTTNTSIRRIAKAGGDAESVSVLKDRSENAPLWLAFDEGNVYCSTAEGGTVVRAPKTGGPFEVMATSAGTMGGVAVNGSSLFWADYSFANGAIHRVDLSSGSAEILLPVGGATLRVAGGDLWFASEQEMPSGERRSSLARLDVDPTPPGALKGNYTVPNYTLEFESDFRHVYWSYHELMRIDLQTGGQELVALLAGSIAITDNWIFVGFGERPGRIVRLWKPL